MIRFSVDGGPPQTYCDVCADWRYLLTMQQVGRLEELPPAAYDNFDPYPPCDFCGQTADGEIMARHRKSAAYRAAIMKERL